MISLFLVALLITTASSWTQDDFEIFDLVDEIKKNFYEVINIHQSASPAEIRKAFRKLSIQIHPDKNPAPDAADKFRELAAVYEVLKDEHKRKKYDEILEHGLPDWRQPVFYYRSVRKMGGLELAVILSLILTIGHAILLWAKYIEEKFNAEEIYGKKKKRKKKGRRDEIADDGYDLDENIPYIPRPSLFDILPVRFSIFMFHLIVYLPTFVTCCFEELKEKWKTVPISKDADDEDDSPIVRRTHVPRTKVIPERDLSDMRPPVVPQVLCTAGPEPEPIKKPIVSGKWSDEETSQLAKAVVKFPSGTSQRWEKIAESLGRGINETIKMAGQIKQGLKRGQVIMPSQIKTEVKDVVNDDAWTQQQQDLLQKALKTFPRGSEERWEKIAETIPNKSKEMCISRFKSLASMIGKPKAEG